MSSEGKRPLFHCIPVRYIFTISASIGLAIIYILRANISILMLSMVNHTAIEGPNYYYCMKDGPMHWTRLQQALILSSYYWGFILLHIVGTKLVKKYSAKWLTFIAVVINIIANLAIPFATTINYGAVIGMRVIQGFSASITLPAMYVLLYEWSPQQERAIMSKIIYMGMNFGSMLSILCSGLLSHYFGWKLTFYVTGVIGFPWCIFWACYISIRERTYISNNKGYRKKKTVEVPWKSICTSRPFFAIVIAHLFNNWGSYLFLIEMPFYISSVLRYDLIKNSIYASIPYVFQWFFSVIYYGFVMFLLITHRISVISLRKISTAIGGLTPAICLCVINFVEHDPLISIVMLHISITSLGTIFHGFMSNHLDIAPRFTDTLMGITNTISQIPGITIPFFVGYITEITDAIHAWYIILYVIAGMYTIEVIFYTFLASANIQKWNIIDNEEDDE